ncbi:protein-L-isoaspartate(D-aspartate) O-methyltransferase [Tsuneonella sp. YG55]|uniref:Protein-L-isoaspartate O-methyltransferase n=1 Tax=Tsuneonella litorea TaxID=2976475 RepID=A0A9X2VZT5_9SPHN|nr:protein-L-isoaspartate(D-aspartate) O-methyltransferase [Tsuneonella litorea]MCT2557589.1 protein-L-isoaspartate(D-aspartate) O-methyltransferase [Tsuneonella litorea]
MGDEHSRRSRMVERQITRRGLTDRRLLDAFRAVPREAFVPAEMREFAYEDGPLPIGEGQTISQPYIVAAMIDAAAIRPADRVLEVGAGSGYAAAVLSRMAGEVFAIERHSVLAREAAERVAALGYDNCEVIAGDGMAGLPEQAPFDAILVAARGEAVPDALMNQLKIGGRLVMPVGGEDVQQLRCITRTGQEQWSGHDIAPVRFVPLLPGAVPEDGARSRTDHRPARAASLSELIAAHAVTLPDPADHGFAEAFDGLADRRVVMLGECSHGTREFYEARAAITRRFVETHGFTIVAAEADWPDAAVLDRAIRHLPHRADAPRPFTRFPTWMWRNPAIARLMHDLHAINRDRAPDAMAGFYGLDIYNMAGSIAAVLAYLDETDPAAAAVARERYGCLTPWQSDPAVYGRAAVSAGYAACEDAVVDQCRELLDAALVRDGEGFGAAMNARLVASAERYYRVMYYGGSESWNLRDAHMAETLGHLLDHGGPDAKALVWAHNSHIGDARATDMGAVRGEHNIGQLARERWGEDVALVGFGTHTGTVSAASDWDGEREVKRVLPSRPDSIEHPCHETGIPRFLVIPGADPALRARLAEPRLERFIGVIYRPQSERWSHYSEASLSEQFDAYVWFDETSALEPAGHEPHDGAADTFPFGI